MESQTTGPTTKLDYFDNYWMELESDMIQENDFVNKYSREFMKDNFDAKSTKELRPIFSFMKYLDEEDYIQKSRVRTDMAMAQIRKLAISKAMDMIRKEQELICILMGTCPTMRQSLMGAKGLANAKLKTGAVYDLDLTCHTDKLNFSKVY